MASYPSLGQTTQTREARDDGVQFERASNGALRARAMWPDDKLTLSLDHIVERDDVDTLMALYRANRTLAVDVTYAGDGQTYAMYFDGPPQASPAGGVLWRVVSKMVQA